jgi:hypothetical protein
MPTIPFDPKWRNIAISQSGGADSALLTYLLCSMITDDTTVHVINNIRCWKTRPWQSTVAQSVHRWLVNRFPNIRFERHVNFVPPELEWGDRGRTIVDEYGKLVSGDTLELRAFAEYVCFNYNVDAYFNAVTKNPRDVDFKGMPTRDIDPTEENAHLEKMMHMGKLACHPFRFTEKGWIVKKYKELDIMDLFDLTRSCEGEFENLNYENYTPGQYVPVCNTCFWCKERAWAIEQNK